MRLRVTILALLGAATLLIAGCGGTEETGRVPESAALAPRDALGFVSVLTDEDSGQWQRADRLLGLFPGARRSLLDDLERDLREENLVWPDDVLPALGPEVVIVVTANRKVVALTQPDDPIALDKLVRTSDDPLVTAQVSDWTALAESQADIDAYRTALAAGTLDSVPSFREALEALPAEALAIGWTDLEALAAAFADAFGGAVDETEIGVRDLAAAVSAEDDGVFVSIGVRATEGTGDTTYDPKLLDRVPADSVVAFSFGGTQGALDRVERTVDVGGIAGAIDDVLGVSLEGVLEALSGEGVLYMRSSAGALPEVTLVLDPPDADKTWQTIQDIAQKLATDSGGRIETVDQGGRTLNRLVVEDVAVTYLRLDSETLLVTTDAAGIDAFTGDDAKLTADADFERAAEHVGLGERTRGFLYVDLDGLIPFIEGLGGPDAMPREARDALTVLDAFILQASGDGDTTRLEGFVRVNR